METLEQVLVGHTFSLSYIDSFIQFAIFYLNKGHI